MAQLAIFITHKVIIKQQLNTLINVMEGAKSFSDKNYIKDLYLNFASVYAKLDNYQKAYEYHTLYTGMKDALLKGRLE